MTLAADLRRIYHLDTVAPEHPIRRAADELERLQAELEAGKRIAREAADGFAQLRALLPEIDRLRAEVPGIVAELVGLLDGVLAIFDADPRLKADPGYPVLVQAVALVREKAKGLTA